VAQRPNAFHGVVERHQQFVDLLRRLRMVHPQKLEAKARGDQERPNVVVQRFSSAAQLLVSGVLFHTAVQRFRWIARRAAAATSRARNPYLSNNSSGVPDSA
jgi:hypothetical protein